MFHRSSIPWNLLLLAPVFLPNQAQPPYDCPAPWNPTTLHASGVAQQLTTPGYSQGRYAPNLNCNWIIRASTPKHRVQLNVVDSRFEGPLFGECDDFILVRDGFTNTTKPSDVRWCDYSNPFSIVSSGDVLYVQMQTDSNSEQRGARLSYNDFETPGCPLGWADASSIDNCYRLVDADAVPFPASTWRNAQDFCKNAKSNLAVFGSEDEFNLVLDFFSSSNKRVWIGAHDARAEGSIETVDPNAKFWPLNPTINENSDENDCLYLDLSEQTTTNMYKATRCDEALPFLCKRGRSSLSTPYPPPSETLFVEGAKSSTASAPWWIVLVILAALILMSLCVGACLYNRWRKKNVRVGSGDSTGSRRDLIGGGKDQRTSNRVHDSNGKDVNGAPQVFVTTGREDQWLQRDGVREISEEILEPPMRRLGQDYPQNGNPQPTVDFGSLSPSARLRELDARFDRPHIHMLDSVSVISGDEFWEGFDASNAFSPEQAPNQVGADERTLM